MLKENQLAHYDEWDAKDDIHILERAEIIKQDKARLEKMKEFGESILAEKKREVNTVKAILEDKQIKIIEKRYSPFYFPKNISTGNNRGDL